MALSGSFGTTFTTGYRIQADWSAVQNIANNTSSIWVDVYLVSLSSSHGISSSQSKSGSVTIAGNSASFSTNVSLNGNQKKWIGSHQRTVTHNADGTYSTQISASLNIAVTLNGTHFATVSTGTGNITLDTIPRASTISTDPYFFAMKPYTFSINRASSSFTHTAELRVSGTLVKTITGLTTSGTFSFTQADNTTMMEKINANNQSIAPITITLKTYNGSTLIGTTTRSGSVSAPAASTPNMGKSSYSLGEAISGTLTTSTTGINHTVSITVGSWVKQLTDQGTSFSWTPTSAEVAELYRVVAQGSVSCTVRVVTYYNGQQVKWSTTTTFTMTIPETPPTFSASQISYLDSNTTTTAITGNNQFLIQGYSTLSVSINSPATAHNGATITEYVISVGGTTATRTTTGTSSMGTVTSGSNLTLTVKATDSRGNSTSVTKTVTVVPYSAPSLTARGVRQNGFDAPTDISSSGSFSGLSVNGTNKNTLSNLRYRYRTTNGSFGSWTTVTFTTNGTNFTGANTVVSLQPTDSYTFEMQISDRLASTTRTFTVSAGAPLMFLDSTYKSLGINRLPDVAYTLDVNGKARLGNPTATQSLLVQGTGQQVQVEESDRPDLSTWVFESFSGAGRIRQTRGSNTTAMNTFHSGGGFTTNGTITGSSIASNGAITAIGNVTANQVNVSQASPVIAQGTLSLSNGWRNYGGNFATASYKKLASGLVILEGLIQQGTLNTLATTLPVGCRPSAVLMFSGVEGTNWASRVDVYPSGEVRPVSGSTGWISLSNITFYAP